MKNKFLSSLLAIGLIIALLPATASAQDKEVIPFDSALCTLNPDCTATFHKEGCPLYIMSPDILNPEFEENNAPFVMPNGPHVNPLVINKAEDDLLHQEQTIMNNRMNTSFAKILTIAPNDCDFADIQAAFDSLEEPVKGSLLLLVKDSLPLAATYHVPTDKGITSVTIATDNPSGVEISGTAPTIYTGGIPLTIDNGVAFLGEIFGGSDKDLLSDTCITIQEGAKVSTIYGGGRDSSVTGNVNLTVYGQADSIIGGGCASADASTGDKTASANVTGHIQITIDGENAQLGSKLIGGGIAYSLTTDDAKQALEANVQGSVTMIVNCPSLPAHAEIYGGGYAYLAAAANNRSLAANVTGDIRITLGSNTQDAAQLLLWGGGHAAMPESVSDSVVFEHTSATAVVTGDVTIDASENMYLANGRENWDDALFSAFYGKGYASGAQTDAAILGNTVVAVAHKASLSRVATINAPVLDTVLDDAITAAQYDIRVEKIITSKDPANSTTVPVTQLSNPLQLVFAIPDDLLTAPSGFNRNFIMLRTHDSITTALPDEDKNPATYTVSSAQFSLYTLAYSDTPITHPPVEYPITLPTQTAHGQLIVSSQQAASGSAITVTATPDAGYTLDAISARDGAGFALTLTRQTDGSYTFIMPASAVTLAASFVSSGSTLSGSSSSSYPIILPAQVENGHIAVSPRYAARGAAVTLTVQPNTGYTLGSLNVTDSKGTQLPLTHQADGQVTFTMPASRVSVSVSFVKQTLPFTDVHPDDWFYQVVAAAYEQGLMSGTSAVTFAPEAPTTRGMLVTILYRMEGEPKTSGLLFDDVAAEQYYAPAIAWASAKGIVAGYDAHHFGPDDALTREQMAAILYRYAAAKGYAVTQRADLSVFRDAAQITSYAQDVLSWANAEGLITGIGDGLLNPGGNATRAQTAAILLRFQENILQ